MFLSHRLRAGNVLFKYGNNICETEGTHAEAKNFVTYILFG